MAYKPIEFRRLRGEDFPADQQQLINKIAFSYNNFGDQVISLINGNITTDNLKREVSVVKLQVDGNGTPTVEAKINLLKVANAAGISVVRVLNISNPGTPPVAPPFVTWVQNGALVTITNVLGLSTNQTYQLTLEII